MTDERPPSGARQRHGRTAELIGRASRAGADDALSSLINQFADPLSFLRELVQNSLDAASSRVDVDFAFEGRAGGEAPAGGQQGEDGKEGGKRDKKRRKKKPPSEGLMTITVADNGEGMNEGVIDNYLLTLFRSTKEQDLTKIGKFGVGFVSIFAIEPQLVVLETGQAGEAWRIIFHADASYEKLRLDVPVEGTTIALHRRVARPEFDRLRQRGLETVRYWCKYAEVEIRVDGELIGEAFDLESPLKVRYAEPGTELMVGFAPPARPAEPLAGGQEASAALSPLVGYYNRGLTLVEGPAFPGDEAGALAGLSMRIKSRYLEHTLTRDNVLQDENYAKAMALVRAQVEGPLRAALVQRLERLAAPAADAGDASAAAGPPPELCLYYARLPAARLHETAPRARLFPTTDGGPVSFDRLARAEPVLCASQANPVTRRLTERGVEVVRDEHGLADHLRRCGLTVVGADQLYYTALRPAADADPPGGAGDALPALVLRLLEQAKARVKRVALGELDYPNSLVAGRLHVRQEEAFGLTRAGEEDRPGLLGGARELVLNRAHPLTRACLALAAGDAPLAALLLAQGVCLAEGIDRGRAAGLASATLTWASRGGAA